MSVNEPRKQVIYPRNVFGKWMLCWDNSGTTVTVSEDLFPSRESAELAIRLGTWRRRESHGVSNKRPCTATNIEGGLPHETRQEEDA